MARSQRTKLVLKDLGEPALIKAQAPEIKSLLLGTLMGIASDFVSRQSPDKTQTFEGLAGQFRSIPADPKSDELESGIIFMPDAFHNLIAANLKTAKAADKDATISFAFEVSSVRANNPAGYSWDFKPKIEAAANNPLDKLAEELGGVKEVAGRRVLAIEDKSATSKAAAKK